MKKLSLLIILLVFSFMIQGCQLMVVEEDTDEYRQLSDQYNDYITSDISEVDNFREFMNEASDVLVTSVFMIEADVLDNFGRVKMTYYGTGTLVYEDMNYLYILTTYEMINFDNDEVNHYTTDAYGETVPARIHAFDETLHLGILKVRNTVRNNYNVVDFASYLPLNNELLLMISNDHPIQNIQKLGYYLYQYQTSYMDVISTQNANGSPVFNLKRELIGIQFLYGETYVHIIDFNTINEFIGPLF